MSKVAFIGAGRMASAMVQGILQNHFFAPGEIACTCGADPTGPALAEQTGIGFTRELSELLSAADCIVLACKPQQFNQLSPQLAELASGKLVVSILAGTPLSRLVAKFPSARNVVRAMPNTPGQVGAGITGFAPQAPLHPDDAETTRKILGALGEVVAVEEAQLDAVTAISGSGPAYLFEFTAALREAAKELGFTPEAAHRFAVQTIIGSAKLLEATGEDPEVLRTNVTSPGGTTQAALESFAADGLRNIVARAATAARDRSIELAKL